MIAMRASARPDRSRSETTPANRPASSERKQCHSGADARDPHLETRFSGETGMNPSPYARHGVLDTQEFTHLL